MSDYILLGFFILTLLSVPVSSAQAQTKEFNETKLKAEKGDAAAQYNLGRMFGRGEGVARDLAEAMKWYRKAAEQGHADSQVVLGTVFFGAKNHAEALKWFRKAAEQGRSEAQFILGEIARYGLGVKQDYAEATKWLRKAAEQGYAKAQLSLGQVLSQGQGVEQNYAEAMKWFRKAAEHSANS